MKLKFCGQRSEKIIELFGLKVEQFDSECCHQDDLVFFEDERDYLKYAHFYDLRYKSIILNDDHNNIKQKIADALNRLKYRPKDKLTQPIFIPKTIHFIWLSKVGNEAIPEKARNNIQLFIDHHPDFTIEQWDNQRFNQLLTHYYPQYCQAFNLIPVHIMKCDIARMMILAQHGGLYFDLDFYCRRSLLPLIQGRKILLTEEIPEHTKKGRQLYNGALGCCAHDPFITGWIDQIFINLKKLSRPMIIHVMSTSGPVGFWNYYQSCNDKPEIVSPKYLIPFSNKHRLSSVVDDHRDIYTYTIWSEGTGWANDWITGSNLGFIILALFLVMMVVLILIYKNKLRNRN